MYKIGEYVVHNGHGVCTIIDNVYNESIGKSYYKLQTIHNRMNIMMPTDKIDNFLRPMLSKENIIKALDKAILIPSEYNKDNKERKNEFHTLITSNNIEDTIKLLKMLYTIADEKKKEKKVLGSFDTQFLQQAERKLFNEVAIACSMSKQEAQEYIQKKLIPKSE